MTRAEILTEIKQAEDEARSLVVKANEVRNQKINEARTQAREILKAEEEEAARYYISEISKAKEQSKKEKEIIIQKGYKEAEEIKIKARKNIEKATAFILAEFERAANA